jgi:hypothetical protein
MASSDREGWTAAMRAEWKSLQDMKAVRPATLTERQTQPKTIGSKWVFKTKRDANNKVMRFKCRLVAQGFTQRAGRDYDETYAPVISYTSVRILLAIAVQHDLELTTFDVETAFLHAPLDRVQFILAPKGLDGVKEGTLMVCERALYGLKQSGRLWNKLFVAIIERLGFTACRYGDACVFVCARPDGRAIYIGIFVDDLILTHDRRDAAFAETIKQQLAAAIKIKQLPSSSRLLGMVIDRDRPQGTLHLHQAPYVSRLLEQFGFANAKPELTPESTSKAAHPLSTSQSQSDSISSSVSAASSAATQLSAASAPTPLTMETLRAAIGSLSFLANTTRLDVAHSVNMTARQQSDPTAATLQQVARIFRYLVETPTRGLLFTRNSPSIGLGYISFSDADWAGSEDARSTSGDIGLMAGAAVYWSCSKQSVIAQSSSEAEYVAANASARNIAATRSFLTELLLPLSVPTVLLIDNQTAIRMALDDDRAARRKHINVKHHYIRDKMNQAEIKLEWIPTQDQLADLLTKALPRATFASLRDQSMGLTQNEAAVQQLASLSHSSSSAQPRAATAATSLFS